MDSDLKKYDLSIVFQRMKLRCKTRESKSEDLIEVKRGVRLMKLDKNKINEFLSEQNSVCCEAIENYNSFNSDENFKKMCKNAMEICLHYTKIFFFLEKFSRIVSEMSPVFTVICGFRDFSLFQVVLISLIFFILILISMIGDWERLREKYANLYEKFKMLHNSNNDEKYCEFYRNVQIFNNSNLSIDSI